jgi:hypothetical protein
MIGSVSENNHANNIIGRCVVNMEVAGYFPYFLD